MTLVVSVQVTHARTRTHSHALARTHSEEDDWETWGTRCHGDGRSAGKTPSLAAERSEQATLRERAVVTGPRRLQIQGAQARWC